MSLVTLLHDLRLILSKRRPQGDLQLGFKFRSNNLIDFIHISKCHRFERRPFWPDEKDFIMYLVVRVDSDLF